jgi:hypothetical protein
VQTLEQEIVETEETISSLSPNQIRSLEKTLRALSPAQRHRVAETLTRARENGSLPSRYLHLLEHFFEKWSSHSLATKLVLINRISHLAAEASDVAPAGGLPEALAGLFEVPDYLASAS